MERALQGEHVPLSKAWGSHGPGGGSAAALVLCIRALPLMHGWLHHDVRCIMGTWVGLLSADFECLPDRHLHPNGTKSISKSFWRRYYFTDFRLVRLIPCRKNLLDLLFHLTVKEIQIIVLDVQSIFIQQIKHTLNSCVFMLGQHVH